MEFPSRLKKVDRLKRCPKHLAMSKRVLPCDKSIWERIVTDFRPARVYINIPYDADYIPLAAGIYATITELNLIPVLASARSEGQPFRLCKLCELMQSAKYAISDVSRLSLQNMPFELGYCLALGRVAHAFILTDNKYIEDEKGRTVRKPDAFLSNLKGVHAIVHNGNAATLVRELLRRMDADVPEAKSALAGLSSRPRNEVVEEIPAKAALIAPLIPDSLDEIPAMLEAVFRSARAEQLPSQ